MSPQLNSLKRTAHDLGGWWWLVFWRFGIGHLVLYTLLTLAIGLVGYGTLHQIQAANTERHHAITRNIHARYDDCEAGNRLRHGLQTIVTRGQQVNAHANRAFNVPASIVRDEQRLLKFEQRVFAAQDCTRYANEAKP